ncbi:lamin tail domain-containing protein [Candidatus Saccharibacteria bacterium]|nr:lamin tail domain-containing protein [Candidatus Saccharibacteria bacterium]
MTEVMTGSAASGSEEFVELYNDTGHDIDLADIANGGKAQWKLQYFSKAKLPSLVAGMADAGGWNTHDGVASSPTKVIALSGVVPAHSYFVASTAGFSPGSVESDLSVSLGMASDGGALQLVSVEALTTSTSRTIVHDRLVWATVGVLPTSREYVYMPPTSIQTLQRMTNTEDRYVDADNLLESWVAAQMSPKATWEVETTPEPEQPGPGDGSHDSPTPTDPAPVDTTSTTNDGLSMPYFTELLPNPSSDESDEYVELYNPNDEPFNLRGYELQTGTSSVHSFVITSDTLIPAESYTVLRYADTKLALSNSGGRARLLNPAKQLVDETEVYGAAKEAWAWARSSDGKWLWTDTVTPELANVITDKTTSLLALAAKGTTSAKVKGVATKKPKATTPKKPKVAKAKKPKKAKKSKVAKTAKRSSMPSAAEKPVSLHVGALAVVAVAALAYGGYEYRKDIANYVAKFRRH